jgi:hypothetical protein
MARKRADERVKHNITVYRTPAEWKRLIEACSLYRSNISSMVHNYLLELAAKAAPDRTTASPKVGGGLAEAALTREQVDPEFEGTATQFARQYGYINLATKSEIELQRAARRADAVVTALKATLQVPKTVERDDILAWVQEGEKTNGKRDRRLAKLIADFRATHDQLLPLLSEVESWINTKPEEEGHDAASRTEKEM